MQVETQCHGSLVITPQPRPRAHCSALQIRLQLHLPLQFAAMGLASWNIPKMCVDVSGLLRSLDLPQS